MNNNTIRNYITTVGDAFNCSNLKQIDRHLRGRLEYELLCVLIIHLLVTRLERLAVAPCKALL